MVAIIGVERHYTVVPGTSDVNSRAATIHGQGATALVATWNLRSDTSKFDIVNLSADLRSARTATPAATLTASLAQALKGASHVDARTGAREINQGISDTLTNQIGQILQTSGFSQQDAASASASLVQQFASTSSSTNVIAVSLAGQNQSTGTYSATVGGGTEVSAYSVHNTSKLNIAFDAAKGELSIDLVENKVAATRIEWSAQTAQDVSITLSQPELEAFGYTPVGTARNETQSPVQEIATTNAAGVEGLWNSNVVGSETLAPLLDFENASSGAPLLEAGKAAPTTATASKLALSKQASAKAALADLQNLVAQARSTFKAQGRNSRVSVDVSINQHIGTAASGKDGNTYLLYNRSTGGAGVIHTAAVSVES